MKEKSLATASDDYKSGGSGWAMLTQIFGWNLDWPHPVFS